MIFGIKNQIVKAKLTEAYGFVQTKIKSPRKQTILSVATPRRQLAKTNKKRFTFHAS